MAWHVTYQWRKIMAAHQMKSGSSNQRRNRSALAAYSGINV